MRGRRALIPALALALALGAACAGERKGEETFAHVSLSPYPNPFGPGERLYAPQPHRDHPYAVTLSADGRKVYVALQGNEDEPGSEVAVLDAATGTTLRRVRVGSGPTALRLHPGGRFLAVTARFSNWVSILDTTTDTVVKDVPVPFYTVGIAFTPDGRTALLANRWKDAVLRWSLDVGDELRVTSDDYSGRTPDADVGIPVGQNPRDIEISADGARAYVASPTGMTLSILDVARGVEARRVNVGSPPGGIALAGPYVFVSHTGRGTQHPPDSGFDTDGDGKPGDGTANVMFQDLQNELAVLDADGNALFDYTSDTICCQDFRDVDPDHVEKGAALPPPDPWPPSRLAFLPPKDTWIVAGALPEQLAVRHTQAGDELVVVFSGSNEVQRFAIGPDGRLSPREKAGNLFRTGMNPAGIALSLDGTRAWVAERLGEHVTVLDLEAGPGAERRVPVGDLAAGPFPASDAEIGEGINFVTSAFTVDGDQTCVHCHREGGSIAKPIAMPLQTQPVWGTRMPMAYRGAFDTRPWFMETAMTEANFFPVINEFSRKENFCCEGLDPLIFSHYPTAEACLADPALAGCNHVLHCEEDPPPECQTRTYGSPYLTRSAHFLAGARALFGRDRTVGDALSEGDAGKGHGIPLDFGGVSRSLGLFLLQKPRFFPNPNAALDLAAARRGRALFENPAVGCNACHPLPLTTVTKEWNPSGVPLRFPAVVTPRRTPDGLNADAITKGFLQTFPDAEQDEGGVRFGVPQLRGVWDRAARFYHDGRAPSLREALATPGHPALRPGERGYNETDGMPDTHGATSQLSATDLEDLIAFLNALLSSVSLARGRPPRRSGRPLADDRSGPGVEQRVEPTDAIPEHAGEHLVRVLAPALREQRDVEGDLARRELRDRGVLAHDRGVGRRILGGGDERAVVVGHDHEPVLPERLERALVEPVREMQPRGALRERRVREDDDERATPLDLEERALEPRDLARPAADHERRRRRGRDALRLLEHVVVAAHAVHVAVLGPRVEPAQRVRQRVRPALEPLLHAEQDAVRRRRDVALGLAGHDTDGALLDEPAEDAAHRRARDAGALPHLGAGARARPQEGHVRPRLVHAEADAHQRLDHLLLAHALASLAPCRDRASVPRLRGEGSSDHAAAGPSHDAPCVACASVRRDDRGGGTLGPEARWAPLRGPGDATRSTTTAARAAGTAIARPARPVLRERSCERTYAVPCPASPWESW